VNHSKIGWPMSQLGHEQTKSDRRIESASPQ
jgi:hypothetical protein